MKAMATLETNTGPIVQSKDSIIHFEEGLIGFAECKDFVLMENERLTPFRLLQSTERSDVGFLVLQPTVVVRDYYNLVPAREWEALGVTASDARLGFVICIIGPSPDESAGNFQAPLLINYKKMIGRQVILTDSGFSVRQRLL